MAQQTMYPAIANSPGTELSAALTAAATTIAVVDATKLPTAPNVFTIGTDESSETILYTGKSGNSLTGCTRGFDGTTSKAWAIGSKVARYYTAYDHETFRKNLTDLSGVTSESTTDIVLSAGQQILNATKNARLQGLKVQGRTLIDLLGGAGSGESLTGWSVSGGASISTEMLKSGVSSFKFTSTSAAAYIIRDFPVSLDSTKYYILACWVYIQSYTSGTIRVTLRDYNTVTTRYTANADTSITGKWQLIYLKVPISNTLVGSGFRVIAGMEVPPVAATVYIDEVRLYAVSAADYAAIGTTITGEAIDRLLPYVPPGINGVDGLYVRRYGRNLLPPFTDKAWSFNPNAKANGPYQSVLTATAEWQAISCAVPVMPGKTYYLSIEGITANSGAVGSYLDSNKKNDLAVLSGGWIQNQPLTVPEGYYYILINLASNQIGTYNFNNPQLELGSVATPFQPREDSLIALGGVELHANPNDGSDPDILCEVNGRYEVTRLWRKSNLVGDWSWLFDTNYTGFKRVRVILPTSSGINASERVTKYNGYPLYPSAGVYSAADQSTLYNGVLYITIANTDSGWGDSYTPTPDEIKAYFNGWRMYNGASGVATNPYNGTAGQTKGWVEILSAGNPVGVLPTTIPSGWTPYQLLYRLATPTTETVQEDGALSLLEGDNFIEVGSGYISREPARPKKNALSDVYYIGLNDAGNGGDSNLKKRASEIKQVFKNGLPDFWNIDKLADGTCYAWTDNYDTAATYSVSYIKLDKSPVPSVSGAYAATEKMQIHDLTDAVTEISSTVSVLAAKKAEKDAGPWITPSAVLSGFTAFDLAYRVNKGFIEFRGYVYYNITDVPAGTKIFNLPTQFRPVRITRMLTSSWTSKVDPTASAVAVSLNGDITTEVNVKQNIIFDGLRFPLD
ncbi:hypothetical protein [Paenibacillus sp. FSL L8-0708]|uniref:hypothetical protein n=1 Tax=Paenibacillus sp. FSL L8-0708 TaxID=2975311 RepID=UPI0030FBEA69